MRCLGLGSAAPLLLRPPPPGVDRPDVSPPPPPTLSSPQISASSASEKMSENGPITVPACRDYRILPPPHG